MGKRVDVVANDGTGWRFSYLAAFIGLLCLLATGALIFKLRGNVVTQLGGGFIYVILIAIFAFLFFLLPPLQMGISLVMIILVILTGINYLAYAENFHTLSFIVTTVLIAHLYILLLFICHTLICYTFWPPAKPIDIDDKDDYAGQHSLGLMQAVGKGVVFFSPFGLISAVGLLALKDAPMVQRGIFQPSWLVLPWLTVGFYYAYTKLNKMPESLFSFLSNRPRIRPFTNIRRQLLLGLIASMMVGSVCEMFRGLWLFWTLNLCFIWVLVICIWRTWKPVLCGIRVESPPENVQPFPTGIDMDYIQVGIMLTILATAYGMILAFIASVPLPR